tara:strand:- start:115 stop:378 length:264 start_codon:yes stop_codon:yes gene_type:complete
MSQNKLNLTITQDGDNGWYRVEMRDHHCSYCCVYEPSVKLAMMYAEIWFANADKREEASRIHGRAVQAMQKLDKEKGILTGNYDGLD